MSSQVRLRLLPSARCLFDQPIQARVSGLRVGQVVTMRARSMDERGVAFTSSATYRADNSGDINMDRDPSLGGSYSGVEPMGLLWSLRADTQHTYFYKNNALSPHVVKISVHEEEKDGMLTEVTNERCLMADGVTRVRVREGNVHGVLFTPPGKGPFPAVLDLGTFLSEKRASLLANKGFIVLAIAVFNEKSENLKVMHLDHFKEAVDFLLQLPKVGSKGVGVISRSKGGDMALALAAFIPGVKAVVWINGCSANMAIPLFYKQQQVLAALPFDRSKVVQNESGAYMIKHAVANPLEHQDSLVPIQQASGHFLFMASEGDLNWDSKGYLDEMVERLKRHGKNNFESVCYPSAGHLLEPPYSPFCPSAIHGMIRFPVLWGGEAKAHTAAEVHMWNKIPEFLKSHLKCNISSNL